MTEPDDIEEIMARVRRLELRAKRLVKETFAGDYHSSFKGQGLDFDEFREYQHGDEIRFIDWNVTARLGTPFIRKFREERELSAVIAVDISASMDYGSVRLSKRELAAEITALIAFSARDNGDKVGLLLFANEPVLYLPPAKGTKHILRCIREILATPAPAGAVNFPLATKVMMKAIRQKSLVFLVSDFIGADFSKSIATLSQKHDLVALRIFDPVERELPSVGKVTLIDPETGFERVVNTSNSNVRMGFAKLTRRHREGVLKIFKRYDIDFASLATDEDPFKAMHGLFQRRSKRKNA
ncbi:DUF58 domain-containing protein [Roseibacillus persicicus]|uniref:DUF58 domain-containing protein n=1 Tax=Roseibacillus persicicus TaxID=454148 RepID=A0A918TRR0_9BACT|nr:DUF58 domain-containing protein [Roseibacillus persicicus]GHC59243.1 DUF58 domain-containing protein [Roseibacillus persicicus]